MQWAVVTLIDSEIYDVDSSTLQPVIIPVAPGTIVNMVVYDEENPNGWQPPDNTKLIQVDDLAKIGDTGYL